MAVIAVRGAALRAAGGVAIRKIRAAPDRWAVRIFRIATPPGARRRRAVPRTASAALKCFAVSVPSADQRRELRV